MSTFSIVLHEIRARPWTLLTSGMAILLGVAALVAIRHVTVHSEGEVSRQLSTLGANILVLPKEATLQDFYSADQNGGTLPEENVSEIWMAGLSGIEKVSPKLNVPATLGGQAVTLTGILPQSEFSASSTWQNVSMFTPKKHQGCKKADTHTDDSSPEALTTTRAIQDLKENEAILGADVAEKTHLNTGDKISLLGGDFVVIATLSRTGTVDDSRVFGHLHTVQRLSNRGETVNAIEIVGCCEDAAGDLVPQLSKLLPHAKVVTISQVVQTQVGVNRLMANMSLFVLAVLVLVGGVSLAGAISANVRERRKEIGTLMAMGATPNFVLTLFLAKALLLGLFAGTLGSLLGLVTALLAGPRWAGVAISPLPVTSLLAVLIATAVALLAAYLPARQAAKMDPCLCFQEV